MPYLYVYTTVSSEKEAQTVASFAVEQKLAACANIFPTMKSFYRWKGKVESSDESVVVFKTTDEKFDELEMAIKEKHSYECPCIIAMPIKRGHIPYLNWIDESMR